MKNATATNQGNSRLFGFTGEDEGALSERA
jgi:hypothetical protein